MKKIIVSLFIGSFLFTACTKESEFFSRPTVNAEACLTQTANPAGHSYVQDSVVSYTTNGKYCGLMPISSKNYWVYLDSIYTDGLFTRVQFDTLQFSQSYRSLSDNIIWWKPSISIGLPDKMYVNDSAIFKLEDRMFNTDIMDAKREFGEFTGDSLRYLTNFSDAAAIGRSLKLTTAVNVNAGSFSDCLYFDKNARSFRRDQVYFKPGIGVLKYIHEMAPMGSREVKTQRISTLVKFYFQ